METTRTLDRFRSVDLRSRNFPITAIINTSAYKTTTWDCNTYNDQGSEGACVGFGWSHELSAEPFPVPTNYTMAMSIYKRAQQLDVWPGEDYSGTSVLGGAKAVAELKNNVGEPYLKEYRWAFGLSDLLLALSHQGPAVLGLNWYTGMFNVGSDGYLRVSGTLAGGHCLVAIGVHIVLAAGFTGEPTQLSHLDLNQSYIILHNSWGKDWGTDGKCKMTLSDMQRLLNEGGDACVPVVRTVDSADVVAPTPAEPKPYPPAPKPSGKTYFAIARTTVFHDYHPGLRQNRKFNTFEEARRAGLRPCNVCRPTP